jgi:deoxycytidylate deaminase
MVYSPCIHCAKTIAASRIKHVYFLKQYKKSNSEQEDIKYRDIFNFSGIKFEKLNNSSLDKIIYWIEKDKQFINSLK